MSTLTIKLDNFVNWANNSEELRNVLQETADEVASKASAEIATYAHSGGLDELLVGTTQQSAYGIIVGRVHGTKIGTAIARAHKPTYNSSPQ